MCKLPLAFATIILLLQTSVALSFDRASCELTGHDYAVLASLKRPVTRDAQGKLGWNGKLMSALQIQDVCTTRRIYDLMAEREKQGKTLTLKEIADMGYVPAFLTEDEKKRLSDHIFRVIEQQ